MRVLIVEDNEEKCQQIGGFLKVEFPALVVEERRSYNSGLAAIRDSVPHIVLLDMSMPTYDRGTGRAGGRTRPYAGRDVLNESKRLGLGSRAIVVTQYETFGEGTQRRTLEELDKELANEFPMHYLGTVYYHPSRSDWRQKLTRLLRSAGAPRREQKKT